MAYTILGIFIALVILTLIFGRRVEKKWEYEADFRDEKGREFGECEIELSRIVREEDDFKLKVKFHMMHEVLKGARRVEVFVGETLLISGNVEHPGRILLRNEIPVTDDPPPPKDQLSRVLVDGVERFSAEFRPD